MIGRVVEKAGEKFVEIGGKLFGVDDPGLAQFTAEELKQITADAQLRNKYYKDGTPLEFPQKLQSLSGITIKANPDKTTTVLGSFRQDMKLITEGQLDAPLSTVDLGPPRPGSFNVLNVPDSAWQRMGEERFWSEVNKPFLDAAIARGDDIVLATKPSFESMNTVLTDGSIVRTFFGREVEYLKAHGFRYDERTGAMRRGDSQ